jgi:hypothetical protein
MAFATGSMEKLTSDNGHATGLDISADGKTAMFLNWKLDWHKTPVVSDLYSLDRINHVANHDRECSAPVEHAQVQNSLFL